MRINPKLGLVALAAALLLATVVSTASARNLSVSNQQVRVTWRSLEFASSLVTIRCPVTLEGSFHSRTIAKNAGSLIGAVTRVAIKNESCTNGTARVVNLPWHITYEGFNGVLPNITGINLLLNRFRFRLTVPGFCTEGEYGTATDNITGVATREAGGAITGLEPVEGRNTATLVASREFCPATGRLRGRGEVMLLGTTTRITVTLI